MNTYGRLPVSFVKGNGAYLQDDKGNQYLDALTGIAVCGLVMPTQKWPKH